MASGFFAFVCDRTRLVPGAPGGAIITIGAPGAAIIIPGCGTGGAAPGILGLWQ